MRYLIYGVLIILSASLIWFFIANGFWPVALVNYQPVFYRDWSLFYSATYSFYKNTLNLNKADVTILEDEKYKKEFRRAALESSINEKIIHQELIKRFGRSELARIVSGKVGKIDLNKEEMKKGAELLYGLSAGDFQRIILIPKAEEEILGEKLLAEGNNLSSWLNQKRGGVRVMFFIGGYYWDKNGLQNISS